MQDELIQEAQDLALEEEVSPAEELATEETQEAVGDASGEPVQETLDEPVVEEEATEIESGEQETPADLAFRQWAEADPQGAQAYLDQVEAERVVKESAKIEQVPTLSDAEETERATLEQAEIVHRGMQWAAGTQEKIDRYNANIRDYNEMYSTLKAEQDEGRGDTPAAKHLERALAKNKGELENSLVEIQQRQQGSATLSRVESIAKAYPPLQSHILRYATLVVNGYIDINVPLKTQIAVINESLRIEGRPPIGSKAGSGKQSASLVGRYKSAAKKLSTPLGAKAQGGARRPLAPGGKIKTQQSPEVNNALSDLDALLG